MSKKKLCDSLREYHRRVKPKTRIVTQINDTGPEIQAVVNESNETRE